MPEGMVQPEISRASTLTLHGQHWHQGDQVVVVVNGRPLQAEADSAGEFVVDTTISVNEAQGVGLAWYPMGHPEATQSSEISVGVMLARATQPPVPPTVPPISALLVTTLPLLLLVVASPTWRMLGRWRRRWRGDRPHA